MESVQERSISRALSAYNKYTAERKKKALKIIPLNEVKMSSAVPPPPTKNKSAKVQCKALNLNGSRCNSWAVCSGLCRRHQL